MSVVLGGGVARAWCGVCVVYVVVSVRSPGCAGVRVVECGCAVVVVVGVCLWHTRVCVCVCVRMCVCGTPACACACV